MAHYRRPGWFTRHVFNRVVARATRLGMSVWGSRILQVPGRRTGAVRATPVNLLEVGDQHFLVAPRGETEWVRNLRVAGGGDLVRGRRAEHFRAEELTSDQEKVSVLRPYLRRWRMETGVFFDGVTADSPDSELLRIAPRHPVFRVHQAP